MNKETTNERVTFQIPRALMPPQPYPPSAFELGVVDQLKGLAAEIESGASHIRHFALTVSDDKQRLEIEVS